MDQILPPRQKITTKVTTKTSSSDSLGVNLGVPQGSVLGPLLFWLYINDVKLHLDADIYHLLYADDLQIYVQTPPENVNEAIEKLSSAARNINIWAKSVSLRLNPDKTKTIHFGTSHFVD